MADSFTHTFTFMGTGAGCGVPAFFCECPACQEAREHPRARRGDCGAMIRGRGEGGLTVLIDTPPDVRHQLNREGVRAIDRLLVTHGHSDHIGGMEELEYMVQLRTKAPLPTYASPGTLETIAHEYHYMTYCLDMHEIMPYETIEIDLSAIEPTVSWPHLPENTRTIDEVGEVKIDQVVIGSCTNGRLEDMKAAAEILKGKKVARDVRCIIIPATQQIYKECIRAGYIDIFIDAGCAVSTPTCGPCLGGYMGILAEHERCVATTNRNFIGRMGHNLSEIYLANPAVAAASAITGRITDPKEVM